MSPQSCYPLAPLPPTDVGNGGKEGKGKGKNAGGGGTVPVEVAKVTLKNVPVDISVVGNVEAYSVVTVRAQTGGMLTEVHFKEGDNVKKGDLLFVIDPKPLEGQMNSAKANLAKSNALLKQAQAQLLRDTANANYARDQAERYQKGVDQGVFAKEQAEQLKSAAVAQAQVLEADRAAIGSAEAQIQSDQSAINNLNIQLGYTTVEATIEGRSGNILQKAGNIVTASTTDLATIYQVEPIYVTIFRPGGPAGRREAVFQQRQAGGDCARPGWQRRCGAGRAEFHRQFRGHLHGHHQAERHLPE